MDFKSKNIITKLLILHERRRRRAGPGDFGGFTSSPIGPSPPSVGVVVTV